MTKQEEIYFVEKLKDFLNRANSHSVIETSHALSLHKLSRHVAYNINMAVGYDLRFVVLFPDKKVYKYKGDISGSNWRTTMLTLEELEFFDKNDCILSELHTGHQQIEDWF